MKEILIEFLLVLNEKGLINNYDFDYEKVSRDFANKDENKHLFICGLNRTCESIDEVKGICPHPFDEQETTFGGGVLCSKCNKLISKPEK